MPARTLRAVADKSCDAAPGQNPSQNREEPLGQARGCFLKSPFGKRQRSPSADFFPPPLFPPFPPAPPTDHKETDGDGPDVALPPGSEQPPAELPGSAAPLGSPPPSEPSEAASDAASITSSAAHGAEAQTAESGSSSGSAPDSEKEGRKGKQHLYCPTCKVTVNSLSQLEAHNTGKGSAWERDRAEPRGLALMNVAFIKKV